jgi:hypothetical protein
VKGIEHGACRETSETRGRARRGRERSEVGGQRSEDRLQRTEFRISDCGLWISELEMNGFNDFNDLNPPASPEGEADGGQAF